MMMIIDSFVGMILCFFVILCIFFVLCDWVFKVWSIVEYIK